MNNDFENVTQQTSSAHAGVRIHIGQRANGQFIDSGLDSGSPSCEYHFKFPSVEICEGLGETYEQIMIN